MFICHFAILKCIFLYTNQPKKAMSAGYVNTWFMSLCWLTDIEILKTWLWSILDLENARDVHQVFAYMADTPTQIIESVCMMQYL